MWRNMILAAGLFVGLVPAGTLAQEWRQKVEVEVYLPEGARLFFEGQETRSTGPKAADRPRTNAETCTALPFGAGNRSNVA